MVPSFHWDGKEYRIKKTIQENSCFQVAGKERMREQACMTEEPCCLTKLLSFKFPSKLGHPMYGFFHKVIVRTRHHLFERWDSVGIFLLFCHWREVLARWTVFNRAIKIGHPLLWWGKAHIHWMGIVAGVHPQWLPYHKKAFSLMPPFSWKNHEESLRKKKKSWR